MEIQVGRTSVECRWSSVRKVNSKQVVVTVSVERGVRAGTRRVRVSSAVAFHRSAVACTYSRGSRKWHSASFCRIQILYHDSSIDRPGRPYDFNSMISAKAHANHKTPGSLHSSQHHKQSSPRVSLRSVWEGGRVGGKHRHQQGTSILSSAPPSLLKSRAPEQKRWT